MGHGGAVFVLGSGYLWLLSRGEKIAGYECGLLAGWVEGVWLGWRLW